VKILTYIALIVVASAGALRAQTNSTAVDEILALVTTNAPAPKPQPRPETLIEADGPADFDLAG
jgi:hypothetical protein